MSVIVADKVCNQVAKMVFKKTLNGAPVNSFEPRNMPGRKVRPDGILYVNDICYDKEYPNSFLDIWYPNEDTATKRPTIIYFHGGGFIFGDKVTGDPLAEGADNGIDFYSEIVKRGYNFISVNYCLAPKHRWPAQIHQVNRLMAFLTENHGSYGLDMDNVILMGSSAGANLTQIYGMLLANSEYAARLGVEPALKRERVKALAIDESALTIKNVLNDKNMVMMTQTWLGTSDLEKSEPVRQLDMEANFAGDYLPTYLIASNREAFFEQGATAFANLLEASKIRYEYYYRDKSYDDLEHGFMQRFASNGYAKECFEGMMRFIEGSL